MLSRYSFCRNLPRPANFLDSKLSSTASPTIHSVRSQPDTLLHAHTLTPPLPQIYGIEPNTALHSTLQRNIRTNNLQNIYTIIPCGVEDSARLASFDLREGTVDTVVVVQVLCSVPQPQLMVEKLYKLLKPGGTTVVYEHVRALDEFTKRVQCKCPPIPLPQPYFGRGVTLARIWAAHGWTDGGDGCSCK